MPNFRAYRRTQINKIRNTKKTDKITCIEITEEENSGIEIIYGNRNVTSSQYEWPFVALLIGPQLFTTMTWLFGLKVAIDFKGLLKKKKKWICNLKKSGLEYNMECSSRGEFCLGKINSFLRELILQRKNVENQIFFP